MNADREFVAKYLKALGYTKNKGTYHDYERMKKYFQNHVNYEEICTWIASYLGI
jgi:peptide methionine sulfoxide reductase MsrB